MGGTWSRREAGPDPDASRLHGPEEDPHDAAGLTGIRLNQEDALALMVNTSVPGHPSWMAEAATGKILNGPPPGK